MEPRKLEKTTLNEAVGEDGVSLEQQWDDGIWKKFCKAFEQKSEIIQIKKDVKELVMNLDALLQFHNENSNNFPKIGTDFVSHLRRSVNNARRNGYAVIFVAKQKLAKELQKHLLPPQAEEQVETPDEKTKRYGNFVRGLMDKGYLNVDEQGIYINPNIPPEESEDINADKLAKSIWKWAKESKLRITWGEVESPDNAFAVAFVECLEKVSSAKTQEVCHDFIEKCIAENKGLQRTEDGCVILTEPLALKEAYTKEEFRVVSIIAMLRQMGIKDQTGKTLTFEEIRKLIAPLDQEKVSIDGAKEGEETIFKPDQKESFLATSGKRQPNKYQKLLIRLKNSGYVTKSKDSKGREIITIDPNFMIKKYSAEDIKCLAQEMLAYAQKKKSRLVCLKPKEQNPLAKALISALTLSVRLGRPQNDR